MMNRPVPPSASTAKTLILIGLILQALFAFIFLIIAVAFLALAPFTFGFTLIFLPFALIGFVILFLVYLLTYRRVKEGNYEGAKIPTLIWAIISLLTFSIISGILYIIAYVKLGDAVREMQAPQPGMMYPPPGYPVPPAAPAYAPPPAPASSAPMAAAPAQPPSPPPPPSGVTCPRCGRPATFIPQYNRYHCYTDQQYV